jgi:hypothetical protein
VKGVAQAETKDWPLAARKSFARRRRADIDTAIWTAPQPASGLEGSLTLSNLNNLFQG